MSKKLYVIFLLLLIFSFSCSNSSLVKNSKPNFFRYSGTEDPNGALFKNFINVYTNGYFEEKKKAIGYFFGVAHATQGEVWCPIEDKDYFQEFDSWIYSDAKQDDSLKNKSSKEVIINFLKEKNPCDSNSKKLSIKTKEIKINWRNFNDFLSATLLKEYLTYENFWGYSNRKEDLEPAIGTDSYVSGIIDATYDKKWCADSEMIENLYSVRENEVFKIKITKNSNALKVGGDIFKESLQGALWYWEESYLSTWKKSVAEKQKILKQKKSPASDVITEVLAKNLPCRN